MFINPKNKRIATAITLRQKGVAAKGNTLPNAVGKPTAIAAQAITIIAHFIKPTSKPTNSPKASFA